MSRRPLIAAALVLVAALPAAARPLQIEDELRQRLARTGSEWVELSIRWKAGELSSDEFDRRMELEDRILALADALVGDETLDDETIDALILGALEEFAPDSVASFTALVSGRSELDVASQLRSMVAALTMYEAFRGELPDQSVGLAALLADELVAPHDLTDPWGQPLRYESLDDGYDYRVTCTGPDGLPGTADDRWIGSDGEVMAPDPEAPSTADEVAGPPAPDAPEGLGTVPTDAEIVEVALTEDGLGLAYVARRDDGLWAGWGHGESGPFEDLNLLQCGSVRGACVFVGLRDGAMHLVTPLETRPAPQLVAAAFVHGTTDLIVIEATDDGGRTGTVAGRPMTSTWMLSPGQATPPAYDSENRALAWRERLEDGRYVVHVGPEVTEPVEWASAPVVLNLATGDTVAFRLWDGERTTAVVGTDGFDVAWAREPVVSPDGDAWAMAVCLDGEPAADFESAREQQSADRVWSDYTETVAFTTTRANMIVNGALNGVDRAWNGDAVFADDGSSWAYRTRDAEGRWEVHHVTAEGVVGNSLFDEVTRPIMALGGRHVLYTARRDGAEFMVCDDVRNEAPFGLWPWIGDDGYAWVQDDEGQRVLVTAAADFSAVTSVARADEIVMDGILPGTSAPYARLRDGDEWKVWADGLVTPSKAAILAPKAGEGVVAFAYEVDDDRFVPAVLDLETGDLRTIDASDASPGFDGVGEPVVGATGAIGFEVAADCFVFRLFDSEYPTPTGGGSRLLTFQDGEWLKGPLVDDIDQLRAGADGSLVYRATDNDRQRVDRYADSDLEEGAWFAAVEELQLLADGTPLYVARDFEGRECIVKGDLGTPFSDSIEQLAVAPDDRTPVWVAWFDGQARVALDGETVDVDAEPLGDWLWTDDGSHLIYRALHVDRATAAEIELLVIVRRGATGAPIVIDGQAVSAPRLVDDGRAVEVVVIRDGVTQAGRIPLD